jgi:hypothetical protein
MCHIHVTQPNEILFYTVWQEKLRLHIQRKRHFQNKS